MNRHFTTLFSLFTLTLMMAGCGTQDIGGNQLRQLNENNNDNVQPDLSTLNLDQVVIDFIEILADHRDGLGCPELIWNETAGEVALNHSRDMKENGFFSHNNREGQNPFDRMWAAELDFGAAAENISAGRRTGEAAFEGWYNSEGHRINMENCNYTHHGVGYYQGFWTHVFFALR